MQNEDVIRRGQKVANFIIIRGVYVINIVEILLIKGIHSYNANNVILISESEKELEAKVQEFEEFSWKF